MVFVAGKTVWSMPERFKVVCIPCKALYKCSAFSLSRLFVSHVAPCNWSFMDLRTSIESWKHFCLNVCWLDSDWSLRCKCGADGIVLLCVCVCVCVVDVRTAQGAGVHMSHCVLHVDCDRSVDWSDDMQDSQELHHSPGNDVRTAPSPLTHTHTYRETDRQRYIHAELLSERLAMNNTAESMCGLMTRNKADSVVK